MLMMKTAPTYVNGQWVNLMEPVTSEITLATAKATTGNGAWVAWTGGRGMWEVYGTFGGTTVTLEITRDGGTTVYTIDGASATAKFADFYEFPPCDMRIVVTGGAAMSITSKFAATA